MGVGRPPQRWVVREKNFKRSKGDHRKQRLQHVCVEEGGRDKAERKGFL